LTKKSIQLLSSWILFTLLFFGAVVDFSKHCFEVADRDCGARPFQINCAGALKRSCGAFLPEP